MSHETDSFIDEVTEEVRRDRLYGLMRRYGWIGILLILLIVGGAAWREYTAAQARVEAQAWGDAVLAAQKLDVPLDGLKTLDAKDNAERAALGQLLAAGAAMDAGKRDEAVALWSEVQDTTKDRVLRDLARLKSLMAAGESIDPAARDSALTELSQPGAPFRLLALEQKAVALGAAGRDEDAVTLLREILQQDGISAAMSARVSAMITEFGAEAAPAAGKAIDAASVEPVAEAPAAPAAPVE